MMSAAEKSPAQLAQLLILSTAKNSLACCQNRTAWQTQTVGTQEEFQSKLRDKTFDLLIIDDSLPTELVTAGIEIAQRQASHLPVLLLTCAPDQNSMLHSLNLGAISFIPATASEAAIRQVIQRILDLSSHGRNQKGLLSHCSECHFEFVLDNDREQFPSLIGYLRDFCGAILQASIADQMRIAVAVEEALQNAVVHGNLEISSELRDQDDNAFYEQIQQRMKQPVYQSRKVNLRVEMGGNQLLLVIRDAGAGFDLSKIPDPTDPNHLMRPHGRGLLLMRAFMDDVTYVPPGNQLILKKRITPESLNNQQEFHQSIATG